jgi:hypothetical protein
MKKIILMLFLNFFSLMVYGQTPTYTIELVFWKSTFCIDASYSWELYSDNFNFIQRSSGIPIDIQDDLQYTIIYPNVKMYPSYTLNLSTSSPPQVCNVTPECNDINYAAYNVTSNLIKGFALSVSGCDFQVGASFKPNLTIQKSNSTLEVCSGEMLDLYALPAGFPNVAYHWQYSLDNQATWIDVPAGFNDMTPNSNFSMQNILGINHIKHWGKTIHFRLGYDQNRPFTNAIAIKYFPCAPIVKSITCLGPKCSGENIQDLKVTFDRDLLQGERLENFAVIKTDSTLSTL